MTPLNMRRNGDPSQLLWLQRCSDSNACRSPLSLVLILRLVVAVPRSRPTGEERTVGKAALLYGHLGPCRPLATAPMAVAGCNWPWRRSGCSTAYCSCNLSSSRRAPTVSAGCSGAWRRIVDHRAVVTNDPDAALIRLVETVSRSEAGALGRALDEVKNGQ